ncbi:MAG TPA: hypothetical protein VLZ75_10465 [Chitinophagales bacterium]|nr:hypothetical protein [Chitinophagales bacterium]
MKNSSNYIVIFTVFIASLYIVTLFLPSDIKISHSEFIFGETEEVYSLFNNLQKWEKWCVWNNDPQKINIKYNKDTIGENASFMWQYKKAKKSKGIVRITRTNVNKEIDFIIKTDLVDSVYSNIVFQEVPNGVIAEWDITLELNDSGSRLMGFLLKRWLIRDIKSSLRNINLYLISENKHIGWVSENYEILETKEVKNIFLIDTIQNNLIDSFLSDKFAELEKIQSTVLNNSNPMFFYRILEKIDANRSIVYFASSIEDTTKIPDSLQVENFAHKFMMLKYLGSEIGYKYAVKSVLKTAKKDGIRIDPNPFISFLDYPVNSKLDTNNTRLSFIIR